MLLLFLINHVLILNMCTLYAYYVYLYKINIISSILYILIGTCAYVWSNKYYYIYSYHLSGRYIIGIIEGYTHDFV